MGRTSTMAACPSGREVMAYAYMVNYGASTITKIDL